MFVFFGNLPASKPGAVLCPVARLQTQLPNLAPKPYASFFIPYQGVIYGR